MLKPRILAAIGLLFLTASAAAIAVQANDRNPDKPGLGWGQGGSNGHMVGTPGPIAGVGLPVLAVAGGYAWIRRQKQKRSAPPPGRQ